MPAHLSQRLRSSFGIAALVLCAATTPASADSNLTVVELSPPDGYNLSSGISLNEGQQVLGFVSTDPGSSTAAIWQDGSVRLLGGGVPSAIDANGNVVGYIQAGRLTRATEWLAESETRDLGTLGGQWAQATAINDGGTVVGYSDSGSGTHAFAWDSVSGMRDLNSSGQGNSYAYAINAAGDVAGSAAGQPAVWASSGALTVMSGAERGVAYGINDAGVAVGESNGYPSMWQSGAPSPLPTGQTQSFGHAAAVNNAGIVVGTVQVTGASGLPVYVAVVWTNGRMCDLNSLLPAQSGWQLTEATGIDDSNEVVGSGTKGGVQRGFELSLNQTQLDNC